MPDFDFVSAPAAGSDDAARALYIESFSREVTAADWHWRYAEPPDGPTGIVRATRDGDLIGLTGAISVEAIVGETSGRLTRVQDSLVKNYFCSTPFVPNVFADISAEWETKVAAVQKYAGEWSRAGDDWLNFMDATSRFYGRMIGVERAEGFVSHKFLMG